MFHLFRFPDVLPFDSTRVELPTTKDDYVNASHVRELSRHCPKFIATQAPPANALTDFWTMVWQEQVPTIDGTSFKMMVKQLAESERIKSLTIQ
jgi:protein tyrosine phosphatase